MMTEEAVDPASHGSYPLPWESLLIFFIGII